MKCPINLLCDRFSSNRKLVKLTMLDFSDRTWSEFFFYRDKGLWSLCYSPTIAISTAVHKWYTLTSWWQGPPRAWRPEPPWSSDSEPNWDWCFPVSPREEWESERPPGIKGQLWKKATSCSPSMCWPLLYELFCF